jgi:membrane protein
VLRPLVALARGPLGRLVFDFTLFLGLCFAFALLYRYMPNTKVNWKAAIAGGFIGALLWVLNSKFSVLFASRVVSADKIYGSFSVFPVFLIGLYVSWLIVLFGAQVTYAIQNRHAYIQEKRSAAMNQRGREFVALRLMVAVAERFHTGAAPASAAELAEQLGVSPRLILQLVEPLCRRKLLVEVSAPGSGFAPTRPLERITLDDILDALRSGGEAQLPTRADPAREAVLEAYGSVERAQMEVAGAVTLRQMVEQCRTHLASKELSGPGGQGS